MAHANIVLAMLVAIAASLPAAARAQSPAPPDAAEVGNVTEVKGTASVTRNGRSSALKVKDPILKGDALRTGANSSLAVIFDDETTFNLEAGTSITVDDFIYSQGGSKNSALFKIARGTVAFVAHQIAKNGDMKIETPSTILGIRGTSGVIEVPQGATPGSTGEVAVKLYQDQDGRVGRIELFGAGGTRLGLLTQAASGFALRAGPGGRLTAVALTISPQQAARDRAFVQRAFAARSVGRQMINQRRNLRAPGLQRPGQPRPGQLAPGQRSPSLRDNTPNLQRDQKLQRQPLRRRPGGAPDRAPR